MSSASLGEVFPMEGVVPSSSRYVRSADKVVDTSTSHGHRKLQNLRSSTLDNAMSCFGPRAPRCGRWR